MGGRSLRARGQAIPPRLVEETFMSYRAPVGETVFFLEHCTSLNALAGKGDFTDLSTG
jgi:hypothetical protein